MKKYSSVILLIILLCIAFLLRSRMFLHGDFYFLPDQGRDMQLAKSIAIDHKLALIGGHAGLGGLFHGPLWWYMIVPFFLLSHGNPFFSLVPLYLLVSFGIIIAGFFIGRKLYGNFAGFLIALLITFSGEFISTISFTSNSQVMPLIFLFYLFTIILFLRGKDKAIIFSLLCIGIGMHFESAFAIFLFPLTLFAFLFKRHIPRIKSLFIGMGLFMLSIINFVFFDLRHQFLMTHAVLNLLAGHVKPDKANSMYANIFFRIHDRVWWFFSTFRAAIYTENSLLILLLIIIFIAAALFVFRSYLRVEMQTEDNESIFLLLFIALMYILYIFYPLPLQVHYIQSLDIAVIFLLALAIRKISTSRIGIGVIVLFLFFNMYPAINWLFQNYIINQKYVAGSEGSYTNQLNAAQYVFKDAGGKAFGYFVYDAPIVTYGIDYLLWWQGSTKYHYIPESKKLLLTYLVMFPAPVGDIHAHDFWKKYVVRTTGTVVSEKTLPGNIIIQKLTVGANEFPADPNYYQNLIFR